MTSKPLLGIGLVLAAAVLWGTTGTAQSFAPLSLSPYLVGALRLAVSAVFFAGVVLLTGASALAQLRLLPLRKVALAGACIAAYNLCFFAGVKASSVAVGTAVAIGSGPIWAGLLQWALQGRAPALVWWAGTLLAVAGGACMVLGGGAQQHLTLLGIGLCLGAGLAYAAYTLLNKTLVASASPTLVTFAVFAVAPLIALPAAGAIAGFSGLTALEGNSLTVVLYLGVVATGVSYLLFSFGLRHISGATGVTLALAEPVIAFVLAVLVVGEAPTALAYFGLALVLGGLALVVWDEVKLTR